MTLTNLVKILSTVLIICLSGIFNPSYANTTTEPKTDNVVCELSNLVIETLPCDPNGLFSVELDFEFVDVTNTFTVTVNGQDYGVYNYIDLPVVIGGFNGDGTTVYDFLIADEIDQSCTTNGLLDALDCSTTPSNCVNFSFLEDGVDYGYLQNGEVLTVENDITVTVVGYNGLFAYIEATEDPSPFCGPFPAADGINLFMANGLNFNFAQVDNTSVSYDVQTCAAEGSFSIDGGPFVDTYYSMTSDTTFNLSSGHLVNIVKNPNLDSEAHVTITGVLENLIIRGLELSLDNICYSTDPLVCEISNLIVTPQDCNPDGSYDILIDFNYSNPGNDFFDLYDAFGNFLQTYALADLPVLHESLVPEGTEFDAIQICINDNPNCCTSIEFLAPECILPCELSNLTIVPTDCDGNFFGVIIDFDFNNASSTFSVAGNGNDYGDFSYVNLPIMIGGLEGDGTSGFEFLITDNEFPNCTIFDQIGAVDCNPVCEIISVEAYYECISNSNSGTSYLHLDLEANNATDLTFLIEVGSNDPIGPYEYQDFPIYVGVPTSGSNILVYAVEDQDCSYTLDVPAPDCTCGASDFTYDFIACTANGWELSLDFEYNNPDENFEVRDNDGNLLGTFNTSQLPITLEAPVGNNNGIFSVRLHFCFLETDCCTFENFQSPFCTGDCHIFNGTATNSDCDDNGLIDITFDFDFENVSDSFYIIIYDQPQEEFGPFAYNNLPVTITDLQADGVLFIIDVVDNEPNPSSNCRWGIDHIVPNCFGPDECMINEVIVEATCNESGTHDILIDLDIENVTDNIFYVEVFGPGNDGEYTIDDFPILIEDYDYFFDFITVSVYDIEDPGCIGYKNMPLPECEFCVGFDNLEDGVNYGDLEQGDTLTIENDVVVTVIGYEGIAFDYIEANETPFCGPFPAANGIHLFMFNGLNFDFSALNNTSSFVSFDFHTCDPGGDFSVNGDDFTPFFYFSSLDTTFTLNSGHEVHIVRNPSVNWEGNVTITGAIENLSIQGVELAIDNICFQVAPPPCNITDLVLEAQDCNDLGEFYIDLDFNATNASDSFYVTVNTVNQGYFAYDDLPISVGPFVGNGEPLQVLVFDTEDQDCWLQQDIIAPICPTCNLASTATAGNCDDDGFFFIQYVTVNDPPNGTEYQVLVNGELYGTYGYDQPTVDIGPLEGNGQTIVLTSVDVDDPECNTTFTVQAPSCDPAVCELYDPYSIFTCGNGMGMVSVLFYFEYTNTSDSFNLTDGGVALGTYAYTDLPITIGPVPGIGQTFEFLVSDQENQNCALEIIVETTNCDPQCEISNFVSTDPVCNPNGGYDLTLNFIVENPGNDFFDLYNADNQLIGTYAISELPLTLENYEPFYDDLEVFNVCINDQANCCLTLTLIFPECDPPPACEIWDLVVETYDCDDDGNFLVDLDFNFANTSDSFNVIGNGNNYGNFAYADLFITLGPFEGNGQNLEFAVFDLENQSCADDIGFTAPFCTTCNLNSTATVGDCDDDGFFFIQYTTANDDPNGTEYQVLVNGEFYGTYGYDQSTVDIGPLEGNGQTIVLTSVDVDDPECNTNFTVLAPNCDPAVCEIGELEVSNTPCDLNGTYTVTLDFDFENTSDSFEVFIFEQYFGTFAYTDLPIDLGDYNISQIQTIQIEVIDINNPTCSAEIFYIAECDPLPTCEIWDLVVETYDCDDDGNFLVDLDFSFANTSDSFNVIGNGNDYGNFAYADLFITLGPFEGNGQNLEFAVFDLENQSCADDIGFTAPFCTTCNLNSTATVGDCDDDGFFFIQYTTANDDPNGTEYQVLVNGEFYGTYGYDQSTVDVGPLEGNGQTVVMTSIDIDDLECNTNFTVLAPDCDPAVCELSNPESLFSCTGEDLTILLGFAHFNTSDSFSLIENGVNFGYFAYTDLPISVGPFIGDGQTFNFLVEDQQDMECSLDIIVETTDCVPNCMISNFTSTDPVCNPSGGYDLTLNFIVENPGNDFFDLYNADNQLIGTYALSALPLTLENYEPFYDDLEVFNVCINDQANCCLTLTLIFPECNPPTCEIWDLVVETYDCDDDGNFLVDLDFNFANTSDSFNVIGNGNDYGNFAYADLFITLGPFEGNGQNLEFAVFDLENQSCADDIGFTAPFCTTCNLNSTASAGDCDDDGFFFIQYTTANDDPNGTEYQVLVNGEFYGTYGYDQSTVDIGPLEGNGQTIVLTSVDVDDPECNTNFTVLAPNCDPAVCEIGELEVSNTPCDLNGTYTVTLDFDFENTSDSFEVFIFEQYFGTFAYTDLPIDLGDYNISQIQTIQIEIIDLNNPSCFAEILYIAECDPPPACEIWDLVVEAYDCDDDGNFLVDLDFNFANTSDSFNVIGNGNNYGNFAYADLFITLGPFEGNGQNLEFAVFDLENQSCADDISFTAPECDPVLCEISDLETSIPECNPNGGYDLVLNFSVENPANDFFDLFNNNGDLIGTYLITDLPITLNNYIPSGGDFEVFQVSINDFQSCFAVLTVTFPECGTNDCEISNLLIEPFCDGDALFAEITFDYNGNGSDSFQILSCAPIGNFEYNASGVYIIEIPEDLVNCAGGDFIPIGIYDLENDGCNDTEFLFIPDCYNPTCLINNLSASSTDCNDDDEFFVTIIFDHENTGSLGFSINGNGEDYGDFEYDDLPIVLGPFTGDGQELEFIITDNEEDDCWNVVSIIGADCTSSASTCIEFEGLIDGLNYGGSNSQPGDLLMIENEVHVTMEGFPDPLGNLNYDYMFATTQDICNPFDAASGNRTFMFNGLRFDFSPLTENPTLVTFPYHNCGIPFAISVNDQQPVTYLLPTTDTTFNLSPTVSISIQLDANNSEEGVITLDGFVSSFYIGGIELQIDNVCFNVENLVPDVWPGDANFDNIANNFDLLNVGIAYEAQGASRAMTSIDWFAMPAENWAAFYANEETNYKHADCDGNGEVDINDRAAILENYDLTHGPVPIFVQVPGTPDDPPFFVDLPDAEDIIIGQTFEAPIILGTPTLPVDNIYGIAFTVEFPTDMMDEDQVILEIGDSWMGEDGQSIIHLNKKFAVDGKFEVAITRINQTNISGQGQIASFIGIIDDILGRSELGIEITHVSAIDFDENPVPLYRTTEVIDLTPTTVPSPEDGSLDIYPNPTVDVVNISNTTGEQIQEIKVYNVLGQLMYDVNNPSPFETIQLSDWAAGIYIVKVELETETVTKRIKKALP